MKKSITTIIAVFALITVSFCQSRKAIACGRDCNLFTVSLKSDRACGNNNDYVFSVSNNTSGTLSIKLFAEYTDGKWYWLGWGNNIASGAVTSFWSCNCTGRYIIYYGDPSYGSSAFPSLAEIQSIYGKAQSQYGRY